MWPDVILARRPEEFILIADAVMRQVSSFASGPESEREAGGILIGSYRGPHVEVVDCTLPLPTDRRLPFLFERRDPGHQRVALSAWRESERRRTFVGEWHTHPEATPTPSTVDLATWKRVMRSTPEPLVFLILGREGFWCGIGQSGEIERLTSYADRDMPHHDHSRVP